MFAVDKEGEGSRTNLIRRVDMVEIDECFKVGTRVRETFAGVHISSARPIPYPYCGTNLERVAEALRRRGYDFRYSRRHTSLVVIAVPAT